MHWSTINIWSALPGPGRTPAPRGRELGLEHPRRRSPFAVSWLAQNINLNCDEDDDSSDIGRPGTRCDVRCRTREFLDQALVISFRGC